MQERYDSEWNTLPYHPFPTKRHFLTKNIINAFFVQKQWKNNEKPREAYPSLQVCIVDTVISYNLYVIVISVSLST